MIERVRILGKDLKSPRSDHPPFFLKNRSIMTIWANQKTNRWYFVFFEVSCRCRISRPTLDSSMEIHSSP